MHVPFCAHKCDYCDFYSVAGRLDLVDSYIEAVITEASHYRGQSFDTLYLGGGTPSILGAKNLEHLVTSIKAALDVQKFNEATIEVNPDSASLELFEAALKNGINRISIGVQSLADAELKCVSRIHTAEQALTAIGMAAAAGFHRISVDVIIGLPGQTWQALFSTLDRIIMQPIDHISIYCLSLEHETPLALHPPADLPSDDDQADLFVQARDFLQNNGFVHYEISNFARPGCECAHNLNYWRGGEYVGLGPAAASHLHGRRFKNRADLSAYINDPCGVVEDSEELGGEKKLAEEAILHLRLLMEGLDVKNMISGFNPQHTARLTRRLDMLVTEGALLFDGAVYRLAPSAVLISNTVFCRVLPD